MVPPYKKFVPEQLTNCKTQYGKWKCTDCTKIIRTYCSCTPGLMYCTDCYGNHHADFAADDKDETQLGGLKTPQQPPSNLHFT